MEEVPLDEYIRSIGHHRIVSAEHSIPFWSGDGKQFVLQGTLESGNTFFIRNSAIVLPISSSNNVLCVEVDIPSLDGQDVPKVFMPLYLIDSWTCKYDVMMD